ncbi:MAG: ATP-binding cassette domain-containing protein [Bacteroidetes bacterium]|nr:ATP-binding cassette domain-containing protein [Bacteroidota bacterium]
MKITLENCGKSYNRKWLFRNVNSDFKSGEKWAFLGANGSGKSTLSLLFAGQVWPTEGKITWDIDGEKPDAGHIFSYISLASPAMELPEEFSVKELIQMHGKIKPFLVQNALTSIADLCQFSKNILEKPIVNFSSGMKQRVKLCIAGMSDTPVLLLDEPLTNLDENGKRVYQNIIDNYCKNRLVIIASNRKDEYEFCDKTLQILADGSVVLNH